MNGLDIAIIVILGVSSLVSLMRGFVREAISLVIWIIAGVVAFVFTPYLSPWLAEYITIDQLRVAVSFLVLFVATMAVGTLVSFLLGHLMKKAGLSGTDRVIGLIFGFARGVVIISLLVWLGQYTPFSKDTLWLESELIAHFQVVVDMLKVYLPEKLNNMV